MDISTEVQLIVIASAFFLLVAIGLIMLILIYQKKQLRHIFEKKQLQNQYNEAILKSRIESQEATLKNVSQEIHDNIGQLLNSARLILGTLQRQAAPEPVLIKEAEGTVAKAIQDLRMLTKSLNHEWLEQFNFYENLEAEVNRINASRQITIHVEHNGIIEMPTERQLVLFRIVQEAIQNVLKHGEASTITIQAGQLDSLFTISIADNGKGFDVNDASRHGFGIMTMKERVALMNGQIDLTSGREGTTVSIKIPLQHAR
jgi:signal transduction histidine kinase